MKTLVSIFLATAVSFVVARAEETVPEKAVKTAKEVGSDVAETTENVAKSVAKGTKRAANAVVDAVTPDADARKVNVRLSEHDIDMPKTLKPGKTAFVVKNSGKEKHNFEVEGQGVDQKFLIPLAPDETKVLHVNLKQGTYEVSCPLKDDAKKGMKLNLTVR
jgi:iron uptake system EfeUOB component EfeO/EfeM